MRWKKHPNDHQQKGNIAILSS